MGASGPFPYLADVPLCSAFPCVLSGHYDPIKRIASLRPTKKPHEEAFLSKKDLVAGVGFEPTTFGL